MLNKIFFQKLTTFKLRAPLLGCIGLIALSACSQNTANTEPRTPCTSDWYHAVEAKVPTGDGRGHGPDIASMEWHSVIEFKLGIRGSTSVPSQDSQQWCDYIDKLVFNSSP